MQNKFLATILLVLSWLPHSTLATVPTINQYRVENRDYALEPDTHHFSISAFDKSLLAKPTFPVYTHLNPLDPEGLYTIPPYPETTSLPSIGKWMVITNVNAQPIYNVQNKPKAPSISYSPAHWISLTNARGQYIIEPINYIFIVYAKNHHEAITLLNTACDKAGFKGTASQNHSDGYRAFIGNSFISQLKNNNNQALTYSNGDYKYQNDHFRIFGEYTTTINGKQAYVFTASISEESGIESEKAKLSPQALQADIDKMKAQQPFGAYTNYGHHFVSFAHAKNNLAVAMIKSSHPTYYATLGNTINTLGESTEDHDGNIFITEIFQ